MKFLPTHRVLDKIGLNDRVALWRLRRKDPDFPKPLNLSGVKNLWVEDELDEYMAKKADEREALLTLGQRGPGHA